jgi:hypothetical protein
MKTEDKLQLFANEINDIQDEKLRRFAVNLILNAPDYFFTVPASSSGKYHPYFAREEGGLVKHTRCVVFYAECNAESFDFNSHDRDLLIIAAITHDIKKQGDNNSGKHTIWEHPELAAKYVMEIQAKYPTLIAQNDAFKIAEAVLCHMGKWAHHAEFVRNKKAYPMPKNMFEYALQSADYIASRTELTGFAFREPTQINLPIQQPLILEQTQIESKKEEYNIGDEIFRFGKYTGKTIKEVVDADYNYIDWMINKANFNKTDFINKIKAYLLDIKKNI